MINKEYIILTAEGGDFRTMSDTLLEQVPAGSTPLRLAFFGGPKDNKEYLEQLGVLDVKVKERFGEHRPVLTYIAQRPLVGMLKLEITFLAGDGFRVEYHDGYLILKNGGWTELITGGIIADDIEKPVFEQSKEIFARIGSILKEEGFRIEDIFRQWNYIEAITGSDGEGRQNYQEFNDARSAFYAGSEWPGGYPAATGIGTQLGGIMVELNALKDGGDLLNKAVDNSLQIAAHSYSQQVLIGENCKKTTPKFERARIIGSEGKYIAFVSGTAAIRGEESLTQSDITHQTQITMENIEYLISKENTGIEGTRRYKLLRVYIKYPEDMEAARDYMNKNWPDVPKFSLYADICRDELLIEIEGIAEIIS